jgi:TolB-like protein
VAAPETKESQGTDQDAKRKKRRRRERVRGAWIAFVGRIVAQFVGSAASIVLGLALIQSYQAPGAAGRQAAASPDAAIARPGRIATPANAEGAKPSLVVLPMEDFSADMGQEPLARQLTEVITASLAEKSSLAVISRTSATNLLREGRTLPEIARDLDVDYVLEGSVVRDKGRVRIVAQLIDGRSDEHLWASSYDRPLGDLLSVEGEVARRIAEDVDSVLGRSTTRQQKTVATLTM